jgi:hypothetical protein
MAATVAAELPHTARTIHDTIYIYVYQVRGSYGRLLNPCLANRDRFQVLVHLFEQINQWWTSKHVTQRNE